MNYAQEIREIIKDLNKQIKYNKDINQQLIDYLEQQAENIEEAQNKPDIRNYIEFIKNASVNTHQISDAVYDTNINYFSNIQERLDKINTEVDDLEFEIAREEEAINFVNPDPLLTYKDNLELLKAQKEIENLQIQEAEQARVVTLQEQFHMCGMVPCVECGYDGDPLP